MSASHRPDAPSLRSWGPDGRIGLPQRLQRIAYQVCKDPEYLIAIGEEVDRLRHGDRHAHAAHFLHAEAFIDLGEKGAKGHARALRGSLPRSGHI